MPARPMPLCPFSAGTNASGSKPWPSSRTSMQTPLTSSSRSVTETARTAAVLLDVAQGFLQDTQERDPLRRAEVSNVPSTTIEVVIARPAAQGRELPADCIRQCQLKQRARLERMRQVSQVLVELGDLRLEVGEAADDRIAVVVPDQHDHLVAQEPNVLCQDVDLLEWTVVEVVSQPDEQPLVRRGEAALRLPCSGHRAVHACARLTLTRQWLPRRGPCDRHTEPLRSGSRFQVSGRRCAGGT